MTVTLERTKIDLLGDCGEPGCLKMAAEMRMKLDTPRYRDGVSVMAVPASIEEWRAAHRTARKRADRSKRLGYEFGLLDRSEFADDVLEINLSLPERQGRPMDEGYHHPSTGRLPEYPCARHSIKTFGAFEIFALSAPLRAYTTVYRVNELSLISMILGHGDHLRDDVMYLLMSGLIEQLAGSESVLYYNRHDSGTDGLRYYKERVGFQAGDIAWSM